MLFTKKDIRNLLIPLILEQGLAISVGMADTMMVSSAGEAAISGVSLVDIINVMISSLLTALTTGGAVVISQFLGNKNLKDAQSVIKQDDIVDALFLEIKNDIIRLISVNRNDGEFDLDILMIAKYLERIGDHATNIAETVIYSITGKTNFKYE